MATRKKAVKKAAKKATKSVARKVATKKATKKATKRSKVATTTRKVAVKTVIDVAAAQSSVLSAAITCLQLGISRVKFTALATEAYKHAMKLKKQGTLPSIEASPATSVGQITAGAETEVGVEATSTPAAKEPSLSQTTKVYKVLSQRPNGNLTSIYARNGLRVVYTDQHFVDAPHPDLPITAFRSRSDAERFIKRNTKKAKSPWILVTGIGVLAYSGPNRKLHRMVGADLPQVSELLRTMRNGRRRDGVTNKWALGTVFLKNFKITSTP